MITRRDFAVATISILAAAAVAALAQPAAKPVMHSCVFNWSELPATPVKPVKFHDVFDAPTATLERFACHITTLNPGEMPHPPHHHPEEELMILKEGLLEAVQNDKTNRVETGGIIFNGSNETHSLRNIGTNPAVYYVLSWFPHDLPKAKTE